VGAGPKYDTEVGAGTPLYCRRCLYTYRTSDGNLVNAGNLDSNGANVNRNDPSNTNSDIGVLPSKSVELAGTVLAPVLLFGTLYPSTELLADGYHQSHNVGIAPVRECPHLPEHLDENSQVA
jgi:hypothetical protein